MTRTSPLRAIARLLMAFAMLVVGTMAVDRAAAHAASGSQAIAPPCHMAGHHMIDARDHLALQPVNACDTICTGAAPESSYEALPLRHDMLARVIAPDLIQPALPTARRASAPARYGHGPPPQPAYLRNRRLLI